MKVALYARVSTRDKDQNPEVQLNQLREYCTRLGYEIVGEYTDQAKSADLVRRTAWQKLMKDAAVHKFRAIIVWKLDRPFRDTMMALQVVKMVRGHGIDFFFATQPELNVAGPAGDLMLTIFAAFAQFEKDQIVERVNAGLALARKEGKTFGRPKKAIELAKVCAAYHASGNNLTHAAKRLTD